MLFYFTLTSRTKQIPSGSVSLTDGPGKGLDFNEYIG